MEKLTLGKWIALKDLTNEKLAEKADVSTTTITKLRRKRCNPTITTLKKLANALDIQIEDIDY